MSDNDKKHVAQARITTRHPIPLGQYQHYKTNSVYVVYGFSVDESSLEVLVHYYAVNYRTRWTRTLDNFCAQVRDERGGDRPRFNYVGYSRVQELLEAAGFDVVAGVVAGMKELFGG